MPTGSGVYAPGTQPPPPQGGSFLERIFGGLNLPPNQYPFPGGINREPGMEGQTSPRQSGGAILGDVFAGSQTGGGATEGPAMSGGGVKDFILPAAVALGVGYMLTR
jgi:hypothetical protein